MSDTLCKKRLICASDYGTEYHFVHLFDECLNNIPDDLNFNDTILLEGGADIGPDIYGEPLGKHTHPFYARDDIEKGWIKKGQQVNAGFIGICRGAQLLTAIQPLGKLIQHVSGHQQTHAMKVIGGDVITTSSLHHQMMYPFDLPKDHYKMLAVAIPSRSKFYLDGGNNDLSGLLPSNFVEPEVVWYPKIRGLAIQGHPEYMAPNTQFVKYCVSLVKEYLLNGAL